jgi:hypothetical protein
MSTTRDVVSQINAVKGDWRDVIRSVRGAVQYVLRLSFYLEMSRVALDMTEVVIRSRRDPLCVCVCVCV